MSIVLLQTDPYCKPLATLEFKDGVFAIGGGKAHRFECEPTEHLVWELENLAECLKAMAQGKLKEYFETPSRDRMIGPKVGMHLALQCRVGGMDIFCSRRKVKERPVVDLAIIFEDVCGQAPFEAADLLPISDQIYEMAVEIFALPNLPFCEWRDGKTSTTTN
ncbi:MAG: hypothetical protein JSS72_09365 [Armatimonadetes bacterium]|nr:hypothetical protein [Armatimonadota bacterium]